MSTETSRRIFLGVVGAAAAARAEGADLEKVTGIGGLFFRAKDPKVLGKWYSDHLGVDLVPSQPGDSPWRQEAGPCAFQPFPEKTSYFGDITKGWMVNFRVRNIDRMAAQLRAAGITVEVDPKVYPNGRFARLIDPEGNPVELWEPQGRDAH
ncbi:MAG TPA: VOC family protein [Bryobacteraceae bacterium]|nr:VOC family protein [Bryobacteraceae bacterium]